MHEVTLQNFQGDERWRDPLTRALREVIDPELALSIVDIGLIYGVTVTPEKVHVYMTMTSAACPVADVVIDDVYVQLEQLFPVEVALEVELVWEPPWTPELMSPLARQLMRW